MTKAELIRKIAGETGVEAVTVSAIVESAMSNIKKSLIDKEPVFLRGFGTFLNKTRKTKTARNITQKTTVIVPEHDVPVFKACKAFKSAVSK